MIILPNSSPPVVVQYTALVIVHVVAFGATVIHPPRYVGAALAADPPRPFREGVGLRGPSGGGGLVHGVGVGEVGIDEVSVGGGRIGGVG